MSTKIYTAYRTKPGVDLWKLLRAIKLKAEVGAKAALWAMYPTVDDSPGQAMRKIYANYAAQLAQSSRNEWDLSVEVAIWKSGRHYLIIPFAGSGHLSHVLDFMKKQPELEDYSYWNSSDRPKHVTERAWRGRARAWNAIFERGWGNHLTLSVVSVPGFHCVNPVWAPEYADRMKRQRK